MIRNVIKCYIRGESASPSFSRLHFLHASLSACLCNPFWTAKQTPTACSTRDQTRTNQNHSLSIPWERSSFGSFFLFAFCLRFFPTIAQHHAPINALLGSNFLSALIRREKIIIRKANGAGGRARRLVVVVVVGESIGSRHSAAATCSTCYSMGVPAATVNDALRRPISKK